MWPTSIFNILHLVQEQFNFEISQNTVTDLKQHSWVYLIYVCPCIMYENDKRCQLDATIYLLP